MVDNQPLIEIRSLNVDYWQQNAWVTVIEGLRLEINAGETFGLVGESGCGKSTTASALLGYRPRGCRYRESCVWYGGRDLLTLPAAELQRIRGAKISLVPQNPTTALSPGMRVGQQLVETLRVHCYCSTTSEARQRALKMLQLVSLPDPEKIFDRYPHQLSGGQQQRVTIAMALACDPQLVVLDEPTTGLDVTTQAQILDLLVDLRAQYGMAMFYVTHNLGVVAQICTRIGVMYAGRLVEVAPTRELFREPRHPYTQGLIASVPRISTPIRRQSLLLKGLLRRSELPRGCQFAPRCEFALVPCFEEAQELADIGGGHRIACWRWREVPAFAERVALGGGDARPQSAVAMPAAREPLLIVRDMQAAYTLKRQRWGRKRTPRLIVDGISFEVRPGETLALVGESGSGKTTVARALNGLLPYASGTLLFEGNHNLCLPVGKRPSQLLRSIQLVFQNPDASLNPRQRVSQIIGRPLEKFFNLSGAAKRRRVESLLQHVRLDVSYTDRFPDELSGGERQRVAIARALAQEPEILLLDEPTTALDRRARGSLIELIRQIHHAYKLTTLVVTHEIEVAKGLCDRVVLMREGLVWGEGSPEEMLREEVLDRLFA